MTISTNSRKARDARAYLSQKRRGTKKRQEVSKFETGRFVAIDGEGFNTGEVRTIEAKQKGKFIKTYKFQMHEYALLADSDGNEIYSPTRLTAKQCLDFLCDIGLRDARSRPGRRDGRDDETVC